MLVLLTDVGDGPEVLLTRRSWEMRTHRGEVSFPGGRMDPGETALDTALRETHEEVGLDPELVTVRGELDHLNTAVTRSYIVPKVGTVPERLDLRAQTSEVERVLWVPLAEFTRRRLSQRALGRAAARPHAALLRARGRDRLGGDRASSPTCSSDTRLTQPAGRRPDSVYGGESLQRGARRRPSSISCATVPGGTIRRTSWCDGPAGSG